MPLPGRRGSKRAAGPTASSFTKPLPEYAAALAVPLSRACCWCALHAAAAGHTCRVWAAKSAAPAWCLASGSRPGLRRNRWHEGRLWLRPPVFRSCWPGRTATHRGHAQGKRKKPTGPRGARSLPPPTCLRHNSIHLHPAALTLHQACHDTMYTPTVHASVLCVAVCG